MHNPWLAETIKTCSAFIPDDAVAWPKAEIETGKRLVIFTGAGISADSGIKTFRDSDGTWENHNLNVVANGKTWRKNREAVIGFYNARRLQAAGVQPNAAHFKIAEWQKRYGAYHSTQNIDHLNEAAGATQVLHVHGNIFAMRCEACEFEWNVGATAWDVDAPCRCGSVDDVRPAVVLFNDIAPNYPMMHKVFGSLRKGDVLLVMGTSGQVIDVSSIATMTPATTILSNLAPGDPHVGADAADFDHVIWGKAVDTVAEIDLLLQNLMKADVQDQ